MKILHFSTKRFQIKNVLIKFPLELHFLFVHDDHSLSVLFFTTLRNSFFIMEKMSLKVISLVLNGYNTTLDKTIQLLHV